MQHCIMCKEPKQNVKLLIEFDTDKNICTDCIAQLNAFAAQSSKIVDNPIDNSILEYKKMYPKDFKHFLDDYVIGQEQAKKTLAVEIYNHFKRINNLDKEIQKNNILLVGKSGTGKTLLVQTLAKLLDLPLAIADMNNITQAGYVGKDVESILEQLVASAGGDIKKAETGILILDEIDKIAKRNLTSSTDKDPSGEGAQAALLKVIEGAQVELKIEGSKTRQFIDTTNILFVAAGAFYGIDKVIEHNSKEESFGIGFSATVDKPDIAPNIEITEEDLIQYGFIPELVGRFPAVARLDDLSIEDYKRILTEPKNSITKQYEKLFGLDDIELKFSEEYLDKIANKVHNSEKGARGLRSEIERDMREIIYNIDTAEKSICL